MLRVHQIDKTYHLQTILSQVSFSLNPGERLGLVGPNGSGKTTLLKIITGLEAPGAGSVQLTPASLRLGFLPQGMVDELDETVGQFLARMQGDIDQLSNRLAELAGELVSAPQNSALQQAYDLTLAQLESASQSAGRSPEVLAALGLEKALPETPVAHLSGGQKTRLALAGMLLSNPQVLLLDEPTNHLDFEMLAWLEDWLLEFRGAAIIVSHDRAFLDRTATGILELDAHTHNLKFYAGNYSDYVEARLEERARQQQAYQDQQDEIARLKAAAVRMRSRARFHKGGKGDPAGGDKFAAGFFANRGKETIQKAKNIEKRVETMLNEDRVDRPARSWQMKMEFGDVPASSRDVLVMEDLSVGYGDNVLVKDINLNLRFGARVVLIGPNGTGKTTLLRTIAGIIEPLAGRVRLGSSVVAGYMAQEQENLDPEQDALTTITRVAAMNETEVRAFLSKFLFKGNDVFIPAGKLSYGERARLSLASLVAQGCNFLLLDEPINHLDIPARAQFEQALETFEGSVLAVVHDRYFIAGFASELWLVEDGSIRREERLSYPLGEVED